MTTIVHFEIPADDIDRARKFYSELFGWEIEKWDDPKANIDYWMINTTDSKGEKGVGGGLTKRMHPQHRITDYIGVKSVDEHSSKVQELGGKIVVPKTPVPGIGYFAVCVDTENNDFAIFEPNENAK